MWLPSEVRMLKRRHQPVSVRSLALSGKTRLLRRKEEYAEALGITVSELVQEAKAISGDECRLYQANIRRLIKRPALVA